jgi:RNA polymerase sigma-70 factor (ECF subfamily)
MTDRPWADVRLTGVLPVADTEAGLDFEARLSEAARLAFRVAFGVLRHREDAEDVAQEALGRGYVSYRTLRNRDRFRAWLVRTTWRLAIDRREQDRRRGAREQAVGPAPTEADAEEVAAARERHARIWAAIEALPERLRIVVILANIEGHDLREVAALLSLPEGTVKSRLFAARKVLAERLRWLASDLSTG